MEAHMLIKHALIVDDSKSARVMLKRLLNRIQLTADTVNNADEALTYLEAQQPDIIFMDHVMPGMDGLQAAKVIKSNSLTRHIPTVMCTSKTNDSAYQQAVQEHGAVGVLQKPASPEAVQQIIAELAQVSASVTEPEEELATSDMADAPVFAESSDITQPHELLAELDLTPIPELSELAIPEPPTTEIENLTAAGLEESTAMAHGAFETNQAALENPADKLNIPDLPVAQPAVLTPQAPASLSADQINHLISQVLEELEPVVEKTIKEETHRCLAENLDPALQSLLQGHSSSIEQKINQSVMNGLQTQVSKIVGQQTSVLESRIESEKPSEAELRTIMAEELMTQMPLYQDQSIDAARSIVEETGQQMQVDIAFEISELREGLAGKQRKAMFLGLLGTIFGLAGLGLAAFSWLG